MLVLPAQIHLPMRRRSTVEVLNDGYRRDSDRQKVRELEVLPDPTRSATPVG